MTSGGAAALRAVNPSDELTDKLLRYQDQYLAVTKDGRIGVLMVYVTHTLPGGRKNFVRIDFRSTTMGPAPLTLRTPKGASPRENEGRALVVRWPRSTEKNEQGRRFLAHVVNRLPRPVFSGMRDGIG